jgi:Methyltransferase domain
VSPRNPPDQRAALRQVRQVIERLLRDGTVEARSDGTVQRTVELGLGYGISSLFACEALLRSGDAAASHVVVDPYQTTRFGNCGLQVLEDAGVASLVEHHEEESPIALPRFLGEDRRFELAFVDGNHRFDRILLDLVYLGRLLDPARSCSWTTISCRRWPARPHSS